MVSCLFNHHLRLTNSVKELDKIAFFLDQFCNAYTIDEKEIMVFHLAIDEIITNIISYAYTDTQEHIITLDFCFAAPYDLTVKICDDGIAFNPLDYPITDFSLSKSIDDRKVGGLGIYFARMFSKKLSYERKDNHNILTLFFLVKQNQV